MEKKKKVRLTDIAEKLGVSSVTISKALTNKDGVSDELRNEIKALAESMGYKTKQQTQNTLAGSKTGNIGILIPSRFFSRDFSYYWYLFNYLSKELLSRNYYSIMELLTDEDEKQNNIPRMVLDKKIDGLIILGQTKTSYLTVIEEQFKNFILLDFYTKKTNFDSVSNDDYYCSYMLTNYVISQGHKDIRFVGTFSATTSIQDRYMGFQKAMYEHSINTSFEDIIPDREEQSKMISIPLPKKLPTAFICNCDETAASLIVQLEQMGLNVPQDISVAGFDNYVSSGKINIGLTTVYIKPEDTAKTAADLLISKISGLPYIKGRHLVSGEIIIRDSIKKID